MTRLLILNTWTEVCDRIGKPLNQSPPSSQEPLRTQESREQQKTRQRRRVPQRRGLVAQRVRRRQATPVGPLLGARARAALLVRGDLLQQVGQLAFISQGEAAAGQLGELAEEVVVGGGAEHLAVLGVA